MKRFIIILIVSCCFSNFQGILAQKIFPVRANGSWLPPYSQVLSDYTGPKSQDLMFTILLNDPIEASRDVRFRISIENNGREIMVTNPNFLPMPMTLNQFTPELITGSELADYFQVQNLIGATGRNSSNFLPEGFNRICLEVIDYQRGVPISDKACVSGFIRSFEAPLLEIPSCHKIVSPSPTQNMLFRWLPRHIGQPNAPATVEYEFTLVELLPGIGDPNDGFDQAIQVYQTTTMVPSLLYSEGEPILEPNKTYAWRVQAKDVMGGNVFVNKGYSQVCTFSMEKRKLRRNLSTACEVAQTDAGPILPRSSKETLIVGDEIQLGFFEMTVNEISASGEGFTGVGMVKIPFLKAQVAIDFKGLKINENNQVYELGEARAKFDPAFQLPDTDLELARFGLDYNANFHQTLTTYLAKEDTKKQFVSNRQASNQSPTPLPLILDQSESEQTLPEVVILDMNFTVHSAYLTALSLVENPQQSGQQLTFSNKTISFTPYGIAQNANLQLANHQEIVRENGDKLRLLGQSKGTTLAFNCEGFKHFQIKGEYEFHPANLLPITTDKNTVTTSFSATSQHLFDFSAETEAIAFQLPTSSDKLFTTGKGLLDYTAINNSGIKFPEHFTETKDPQWKGFYFKDASVEFADNWTLDEQVQVKQLKEGNLIIDKTGVWGKLTQKNLLSFDQGRIKDWPFSIDTLSIEVAQSKFDKAKLNGQVKVPIIDEPFPYEGTFELSNTQNISIDIRPKVAKGGMQLWKGELDYGSAALVKATKRKIGNKEQLIPYANLAGKFNMQVSTTDFKRYLEGEDKNAKIAAIKQVLNLTKELDLNTSQLPISGLIVDPLAPLKERYKLEEADLKDAQLQIAGKAFPLTAIQVKYAPKKENTPEELGLELVVVNGKHQVSFTLWARKNSPQSFALDRIEINMETYDCDCVFNDLPTNEGWTDQELQKLKHKNDHYALTASSTQETNFEITEDLEVANTFSFVNGILTIPLNEKFQLKLKSQKVGQQVLANGGTYNKEVEGKISIPKVPTGYTAKAKKVASDNLEYELPIDLSDNPKILLNKFQKTSGIYAYDFPKKSKLILAGLEVNSDLTEAAATILLDVDGTIFGNARVQFKPGSVEFDKLFLYLLETKTNTDPRLPFTLKKALDTDKKKGSFVELACEGFKGFNVQGEYAFVYETKEDNIKCKQVTNKTTLMEVRPSSEIKASRKEWLNNKKLKNGFNACKPELYRKLRLPFIIEGKHLDRFKAPIVINKGLQPLLLKDFESVLFHLKEGYVYYNFGKKPDWEDEAPVPKFNQTTFAGIHFKEIGLQPIGFFKGNGSNRKVLQIPASDFVFQPGEGLYGNVDEDNVVKKGEGDLGGWKYTLEEFKLNIAANKITTIFDKKVINEENIRSSGGMVFKGKILMPVVAAEFKETDKNGKEKTVDGYMEYIGALGFDATSQSPAPFFRIEEKQQGKVFKIPFWKLKMQLGTNVETPVSTITLALNENSDDYWYGSEFEPAAVLNGVFIIDYKPSKPKSDGYFDENGFTPKLTIPNVSFTNWKINDPGIMNDCTASQKGGIRNMHFDAFGLGGTASSGSVNQGIASNLSEQVLAGLPINIWDINFSCTKTSKKGEKDAFGYKIDFEVHVDIVGTIKAPGKIKKFVQGKKTGRPRSNTLSPEESKKTEKYLKSKRRKVKNTLKQSELKVTSQLAITCQDSGNDGRLQFKWAKPEAFLVDAQLSIFTLKGGFVLMGGDPTYGDGFKGYVDVGIDKFKGFRAKTVFQAGKTDYDDSKGAKTGKPYRYFFFDFEFLLSQGLAFGIPNPPAPPLIYLHGGGGGFQYKMIMEDPEPQETFSKRKKSKGVKTVGAVSHDSGILSAQADPYGYLRPGKSLTGFNFKPRPDSYGFGGKLIFSLQNSANLIWWDMGLNVNFTKDLVPLKFNFHGNAYLLTPPQDDGSPAEVGDPDGAAGIGSVRVELNIEKGFAMGMATFDLNYPPAKDMVGESKLLNQKDMEKIAQKSFAGGKKGDKIQLFNAHAFGEASAVLLFADAVEGVDLPIHKAGEWQIKIGTPKKGIGMEFQFTGITFAQMMMYMQAGYAIDPMPHPTEMIPTWPSSKSGKPRTTSAISQAYSGNGMIFGAHFKIPDNTYEFLIFKARLAAGAGFDISMIHYDKNFVKTLGCGGNNGKFGINNWYARGQAYGYLKGTLDMHIDLGFIDKWVNLVDINAIALMQAELPNPTWMRALVKAQGSVLDGLIDVNVNFKVEIGQRCDALKGNPIASIPVLESIAPRNNSPKIPIYQNPAVSFNFPVGKNVVLEDYDDPTKPKKRSFRPHLKSMKIYKMDGGQTLVKNGFLLSKDLKSATLPLDKLLEPKTKYKVEVIASWQEYTNGKWADFVYKGKTYTETKTSEFTTGDRPDKINSKMLAYQAPDFDQRYWHKDYAFPKLLFKQSGYEYMFPESSDQLKKELPADKRAGIPAANVPLEYIIKLTEFDPKTGDELRRLEVPVGAHPGKSADIQKAIVAYKAPKEYANLNYKLPYVKVEKVSGKLIEFRKLNDLDLKKGHLYQLELVRRPVKAFMQEVETQQEANLAFNKSQTLKTDNASGQLDGGVAGGTITTKVTRLKNSTPQPGIAEMNKVLYKYHFGVSQYDHLYEKLADMKTDQLPEKYALAKEKYDHPKSRVEAFPTLPLGRTFKDRYFVFTGAKEGIDKTDRIKLLKNLTVNNPSLPIGEMRRGSAIWKTSKATKTLAVDFPGNLTKGAHPWEKALYINQMETLPYYININKAKRKNSAFDITSLDEKNILDKTRIDEINKKDNYKTIDREGNHTNSGIDSYKHHTKPQVQAVVQFNKFRYQIANHSWFCNKNYGNSTWEAQNALSEAGWLEFMKEILTPYYHVEDWAFHLRFNPDESQLSLSTKEKAAKKIKNVSPKKNIEGTTSQAFSTAQNKPIHFAFEDGRERILKTQFLLAKSVATNLVFVSYLSERDWKCAMGDLFHDVNYWFHRNSVGDGISAADFKDKFVELGYPKVVSWKSFDEVIPKNTRAKLGEAVWKLPIGQGEVGKNNSKGTGIKSDEFAIKRPNSQSDELSLNYPQYLGVKIKKLAVYEGKSQNLLRFYDARINEDHLYVHNNGVVNMTVDYNPKPKDSGFSLIKGSGNYIVVIQTSDSKTYFGTFNTSSNAKSAPLKLTRPGEVALNTGIKTVLKDYAWLRLEWNATNNEMSIKRPIDISALKGDATYQYNSTTKTLEVTDMSVYNDRNLRLGNILSTPWGSTGNQRKWHKTDIDYNPTNFLFVDAKTTAINGLPTSIKSRGIVPRQTNTFYLKMKKGTFVGYGKGYKNEIGYIDYTIDRSFFTRGKATILLEGLKQQGDDCKFKPLPSKLSNYGQGKENMALKLAWENEVNLPTIPTIKSRQFSVDMKIKPDALPSLSTKNNDKGLKIQLTPYIYLYFYAGGVYMKSVNVSGNQTSSTELVGGATTLESGKWHRITLSYDGQFMTIYNNAELVATQAVKPEQIGGNTIQFTQIKSDKIAIDYMTLLERPISGCNYFWSEYQFVRDRETSLRESRKKEKELVFSFEFDSYGKGNDGIGSNRIQDHSNNGHHGLLKVKDFICESTIWVKGEEATNANRHNKKAPPPYSLSYSNGKNYLNIAPCDVYQLVIYEKKSSQTRPAKAHYTAPLPYYINQNELVYSWKKTNSKNRNESRVLSSGSGMFQFPFGEQSYDVLLTLKKNSYGAKPEQYYFIIPPGAKADRKMTIRKDGTGNNDFMPISLNENPAPILKITHKQGEKALHLSQLNKNEAIEAMTIYKVFKENGQQKEHRLAYIKDFTLDGFKWAAYQNGKPSFQYKDHKWADGLPLAELQSGGQYVVYIKTKNDKTTSVQLDAEFWRQNWTYAYFVDRFRANEKRFFPPDLNPYKFYIGKNGELNLMFDPKNKLKKAICYDAKGNSILYWEASFVDNFNNNFIAFNADNSGKIEAAPYGSAMGISSSKPQTNWWYLPDFRKKINSNTIYVELENGTYQIDLSEKQYYKQLKPVKGIKFQITYPLLAVEISRKSGVTFRQLGDFSSIDLQNFTLNHSNGQNIWKIAKTGVGKYQWTHSTVCNTAASTPKVGDDWAKMTLLDWNNYNAIVGSTVLKNVNLGISIKTSKGYLSSPIDHLLDNFDKNWYKLIVFSNFKNSLPTQSSQPSANKFPFPESNRNMALKMETNNQNVRSGFVEVPFNKALNVSNQFTLETWIKRKKGSSKSSTFIDYGVLYTKGFRLSITDKGVVGFGLGTDKGTINIGPKYQEIKQPGRQSQFEPFQKDQLNDEKWHHVAVTFNGTLLKLIVDGTVVASKTTAAAQMSPPDCGTKLTLGDYVEYGPIQLDEFRLWNVERSLAQIQQSKNSSPKGNENGLVVYYNFNHGAGSKMVKDLGPNQLHGNLKQFFQFDKCWVPFDGPAVKAYEPPKPIMAEIKPKLLEVGPGSQYKYDFTRFEVDISGGKPPYTVLFKEGNTTQTYTSYTPGYNIKGSVIKQNTVYSLVEIQDANGQKSLPSNLKGSFEVKYIPTPSNNNYVRNTSTNTNSKPSNTSGKNYALNFEPGSQLEVYPARELRLANDFTIDFWVKIDPSAQGRNQIIFSKESGFEMMIMNIGGFRRLLRFGNIVGMLPPSINSGWHHVAVTVNRNGQGALFLDANQIGDGDINFYPRDAIFKLGDNRSGFTGTIDNLRVWRTAVNQSSIRELFAGSLKGQESQLVLYYDFNQGGPGTRSVKNTSPSGNSQLEGQLQMDPDRSWVEGKQ